MCVYDGLFIPFLIPLSALCQPQVASLTCKFTSTSVCDLEVGSLPCFTELLTIFLTPLMRCCNVDTILLLAQKIQQSK